MGSEDFKNRITLVTGGSSGIGKESAIAFARAGATVVIADIDVNAGKKVIDQINNSTGDGEFQQADISKASDVKRLIEVIIQRHGKLDFAHNNAGVEGVLEKTAECSEENWDHVIRTNLKSVWLSMKYEILQMCKQGAGSIVNTSSVYGLVGCDRGMPAYSASKSGIIGLTKTAALEYASSGIRVNVICPGAIDTAFRHRLVGPNGENPTRNQQRYPIGRIGTPEEVANAVIWLCSEKASYITGSVLTIDGGLTAK